ncbi:MAG: hypothetical protein IJS59_05820, partial [Bacteroidaceae bacterium]|nr:hypothetical protein [Bacteroidaceae bacterium]
MNKNTTKQWLCFMGLAMLAGGDAMAQRLSLSPIQIEAGGTADLVVSIDAQGQNVYGIQTQIKLPAGLTFAGKPKAVAGCMVDEDGVDANATVQLNASNGKLGVISLEGYTFKSQTPVATITVEAAADFVNAKGQLVAVTTTGTSFTTSAAGEEAAAAAEAVPATVEAEYNAYEAGDVISFTGASIGTGIRTYAKDVKTGEVSGMQAVSTWHLIEGDARAAGVFPAASTAFLGSEDYVAPASTTELLGIVAVWTATTQYTTNIVLPAGEYWLPINVYNVGGWGTFQKNLIGFVADDGTEYLAQRTYYPVGVAPTQELIHFSSDSEIRGQLTLGYEAVNQGSGNMPHLFIEPIQILSEDPTPAPAPDPVPEFTDGGDYYLRNLGSGLYLGAANNWGTQASLTVHPEHVTLHKLSDGVYTIESRVSNGDEMKYFTGTYMDGAATPITFAFPDNYSTAYCTMTNGDATYGSDGGAIVSAAAEGDNALWEVIPAADMLTRMSWYANEDRPMDATFLIGDAGFGRNNVDVAKWTVSDDCVNKNLAGGNYNNFANSCAESFHSPFTISQVLAGAPNGVYRLTAQAFYRQDGSDNDHLPVVFANDATATFPLLTTEENSMDMAAETFAAGGYPVDPIYFQVTDGQLTVGVRLEGNNMLWCIWDNFELQYYGNSTTPESAELADIYNTQIQPLLAEAQQILGSTELDEVKQLLGWAKDYDDLLLERSKDAYNKFIADATEQIAAARQIIENAEPGPEPGPSEITLEEAYANALATVANSTYRIFTTAADGAKLYLNAQGYLVGQEEAAAFNIASVTAEGTLYET